MRYKIYNERFTAVRYVEKTITLTPKEHDRQARRLVQHEKKDIDKIAPTFAAPLHVIWWVEPRTDLGLVDWRLFGESTPLFERDIQYSWGSWPTAKSLLHWCVSRSISYKCALEQLTFLRESLREGEDTAWGWKRCLSWGYIAISFCRKTRWWRSFDTHSSNSSGDFTCAPESQIRRGSLENAAVTVCAWNTQRKLKDEGAVAVETFARDDVALMPCMGVKNYLEVIDVILCVQIDAHGFLLDWHDGESDIYAAVKLSLLQLCKKHSVSMCPCVRETDRWCSLGDTYISPTLCIFQDAFLQKKVSLRGKENQTQSAFHHRNDSFQFLPPMSHSCAALFADSIIKIPIKRVWTYCAVLHQ